MAYLGLAYQTYKGLNKNRELDEKTKNGHFYQGSRELKEVSKQQDDLLIRILMKW